MGTTIYKAVENLPEELITNEIAQAAIEEGNIEILDTMPHKFLTSEAVMFILEKNSEGYSWRSFNLDNLPERLRSQEVCEVAVDKSNSNIRHVPKDKISSKMLDKLLGNTESNLKYIHLFPDNLWSEELLLKGALNIYSKTTSQYGPRGGYHGYKTISDLKPVLIFMSYVPDKYKNDKFYAGLFDSRMSTEDIDELTPTRYKSKGYWLQIAGRNFNLVPKSYYDYDIMLMAIKNDKLSIIPKYQYSYYREEKHLREQEELDFAKFLERLFGMMDDKMADEIIKAQPKSFNHLPIEYQTPNRLMLAIQQSEHDKIINLEGNEHLFTEPVCKAYIYRNKDLPTLPTTIWSADFVNCCVTYGTNLYWFSQLPQELQTIDIVEMALDNSRYNAKYVRPELITLERAMDLYRPNDNWDKNRRDKEFVPAHYLKEFENETGLDKMFFGGEVSYEKLREVRKPYTYCRIGHSFLGYIDQSNYNNKDYSIVLTRRTPASFKPIEIFNKNVATFHSTWLEKLISENDPAFVKPSPYPKSEKSVQVNGYFKLDMIEEYNDIQIYANSILGERVYYTAMVDEYMHQYSTIAALKEFIDTKLETKESAKTTEAA